MERIAVETYALPYVKQTAGGSSMYDAGNPKPVLWDNLEGWGGEGGGSRDSGGQGLIYVDVWQKPSQYCKLIILQ